MVEMKGASFRTSRRSRGAVKGVGGIEGGDVEVSRWLTLMFCVAFRLLANCNGRALIGWRVPFGIGFLM